MSHKDLVKQARDARVRLVRFLYCDFSGVTRGKAINVAQLANKLREGVGLTRGQMAINLLEQLIAIEGMEPVGEIRLVPDPESFSLLPWTPSSAGILCDQLDHNGANWGACPRSFLKESIAKAERLGFSIQAGFENEFYLARALDGTYVPFDDSPVYSAIGLDRSAAVMHDIVEALEAQGLVVEQAINEYGAGQEEISIHHAPALRAADNQIKLRDTVRGVALRRDLLASFAPKPFPDQIGSGCHLHVSVWNREGTRNLLYAPSDPRGLSELGRHFIGGLLHHLPALIALTCPSYNSYRRLQPSAWAGAYRSWGLDNREATVRVASPFWGREEQTYNMELKCADGSANPYLALGALITCGLDGIEHSLDPGEPCEVDPASLSEEERRERRLPSTLNEALDCLAADRLLQDAMGELMGRAYLQVRRAEAAAFEVEDVEFEIRNHFYKF
ncbi:MAG: glutamine synthetase family protein [Chloroflexota bacterium]